MMRRLASRESAFAISTVCCWEIESSATIAPGSRGIPSRSRSSRLRLQIPDQSTTSLTSFLRGRWPRKMFSATVMFGTRERSWKMVAIPRDRATKGSWMTVTFPRRRMRPDVGWCTPERHLTRVDLPLPFSPTRPCTSPALIRRSMPSSALTPGKSLEIDPNSHRGCMSPRMVSSSPGLQSGSCPGPAWPGGARPAGCAPVEPVSAFRRRNADQYGLEGLGNRFSGFWRKLMVFALSAMTVGVSTKPPLKLPYSPSRAT